MARGNSRFRRGKKAGSGGDHFESEGQSWGGGRSPALTGNALFEKRASEKKGRSALRDSLISNFQKSKRQKKKKNNNTAPTRISDLKEKGSRRVFLGRAERR